MESEMDAEPVTAEEWSSGYDCKFLADPPEDLVCLICLFVAREAHQLTCCGRVFCRGCLEKHRAQSPKCPNCSRLISGFPDSRSQRQIMSLRLHCDSYGEGCTWVNTLRNLAEHEKTCQFVKVECPNKCGDALIRRDLEEHVNEHCMKRRYKCPHCHVFGTYRAITSVHIEECPEVEISCSNLCDIPNITRGQLESHREVCPKEEIQCPYGEIGCGIWVTRDLMPEHEREGQPHHLYLATQTIKTLKRSVNKMKAQLQLKNPVACFKLANYQKHRSKETDWTSKPFYSHPRGYKLCLNVEPNGYDTGRSSHISVFVYVMKGENDASLPWPCKAYITVELLNQLHDEGHHRCTIDLENEEASRVGEGETTRNGYGPHKFISVDELSCNALTNTQYLKDDCLFFRLHVTCNRVFRPWLKETVGD